MLFIYPNLYREKKYTFLNYAISLMVIISLVPSRAFPLRFYSTVISALTSFLTVFIFTSLPQHFPAMGFTSHHFTSV